MSETGKLYDLNHYRKKEPRDVWLTAMINKAPLPSCGWALLDLVREYFSPSPRYELKLKQVTATSRGKRIEETQVCLFHASEQVHFQIHWELSRVSGEGFFGYRNNTGEPHNLFVDLEWIVPQHA